MSEFSAPKFKKPSNAWMLTFADLLSLILTFFVLLYSMSVIQHRPWEELVMTLNQQLNPTRQEPEEPTYDADFTISGENKPIAMDLDYLHAILDEKKQRSEAMQSMLIVRLEDRLMISLISDSLFPPGSANLYADAAPLMLILGETVQQINNAIEIYGHTDPSPIDTNAFPSNWELSLSRAGTIANELYRAGYRYPIRVYGQADSRYAALPSHLSERQRFTLARRVDVVIRGYAAEQP